MYGDTYHESLMEIRSKEVIDEFLWLLVFRASCLVFEDDIVVPSELELVFV
jgi:hypothetical protein